MTCSAEGERDKEREKRIGMREGERESESLPIIDPPGSHLNIYAHSATSRNCVMGHHPGHQQGRGGNTPIPPQ